MYDPFNISDSILVDILLIGRDIEIEREMMLLLEELGGLVKAIRKNTKGHLDIAKEYNDSVEEELTGCFIYLFSIANMNNVDIFKVFKEKNKKL